MFEPELNNLSIFNNENDDNIPPPPPPPPLNEKNNIWKEFNDSIYPNTQNISENNEINDFSDLLPSNDILELLKESPKSDVDEISIIENNISNDSKYNYPYNTPIPNNNYPIPSNQFQISNPPILQDYSQSNYDSNIDLSDSIQYQSQIQQIQQIQQIPIQYNYIPQQQQQQQPIQYNYIQPSQQPETSIKNESVNITVLLNLFI